MQEIDYQRYRYKTLNSRYLRPSQLSKALNEIAIDPSFEQLSIGKSFLDRSITKVRWGSGPIPILMWAQMHGNEATAALALLDFMQFLAKADGAHAAWRDDLAKKLSVHIIPQLNPDGAENFTRRNAQLIDINRDAVAQQSPEMRAFQKVLKEVKPQWCFNLHDQRSIFSVGVETAKPATLSFLAASADVSRQITPPRKQAMQLIDLMHQQLQPVAPGQFGRYTDEFYPKALGDNLHRQGIATVLIESGAALNDPNRQLARELNFYAFAKALQAIAHNEIDQGAVAKYEAIPENKQGLRDLIIRQCTLGNTAGVSSQLDLALQIEEGLSKKGVFKRHWQVVEVGDLSHLQGIQEIPGGKIEKPTTLRLNHKAHFSLQTSQGTIIFHKGRWKKPSA
jgi:hypothetical protein